MFRRLPLQAGVAILLGLHVLCKLLELRYLLTKAETPTTLNIDSLKTLS